MSINVCILGDSGTGKSSSIRNLDPNRTALLKAVDKPLPCRSAVPSRFVESFGQAISAMRSAAESGRDIIILDDIQYLACRQFMDRALEKGYDKFSELGQQMWFLLNATMALPSHVRVYCFWHTEMSEGRVKAKTIGKMIDEKVTVEGMFTIVLRAYSYEGKFEFATKTNGSDPVKAPIGMFDSVMIENDLKIVDDQICQYYEIKKTELIAKN